MGEYRLDNQVSDGDAFSTSVKPNPSTARSLSQRLTSLVRLLHELDDDEVRLLPVILSEEILGMERRRAAFLQSHVGERCDVLWPGQAEIMDVVLASVDVESGTARVQSSAGKRGCDVPACAVVVRL